MGRSVDARVLAVGRGHGNAVHDVLRNAVTAVRGDPHRHPPSRAALRPVAHVVDRRVGGGRGRGEAARLDDRRAPLAHGGQEDAAIPVLVVDHRLDRLALDGREPVVGVHRRRMIAPDAQFLDGADRLAGLGGKLRQRAVVIEAQHRGEVLLRQRRRGLHRDVGIGVGGIADDQHMHVAAGGRVERLALLDEDLRVLQQQVLALHARAARFGPDQHRVVGVLEGDLGIASPHHAGHQRERRVLELHHHPLQGGLHLVDRQFEELKDDGLVAAEHFAGGDAEE